MNGVTRTTIIALASILASGLFGCIQPASATVSPICNEYDMKGKYERLSVERVWVYQPKGNWSYSHHPNIIWFKDYFIVMWSNGRVDEDQPGQRVMTARSADFRHWTKPEVLVDSQPGVDAEAALAAGGFYQHHGALVAYIPQWEYKPEALENGKVHVLGKSHTRFRLRAITSTDGKTWSRLRDIALPAGPSQPPRPIKSGRLIIAGSVSFPYSDDPSGLAGWKMTGIYPSGMSVSTADDFPSESEIQKLQGWPNMLCEGSFYQTDDSVIHMLLRSNTEWLWVTESRDNGATWSAPVRTSFSDNATKFQFGRLPDGRFYYVGCPSPEPRWVRTPLVLSLSEDGVRFTKHYIIADEPYKMKYPAHYKGGEYGYPSTVVRDGYLYVVISRQKEAVEVIRAAIPHR